jgi:hypothetical protein
MVQVKTTRAPVAHKLARYLRATPVNLTGVRGQSQPSVSHLSTMISKKLSVVRPKEGLETVLIPGIPLMMKKIFSRELVTSPDQDKVESQLFLDQ